MHSTQFTLFILHPYHSPLFVHNQLCSTKLRIVTIKSVLNHFTLCWF